jgi:modification methylase
MNNPHPAPFPVDLISRIISSTHANFVLDPFMGSGTTAIAALMNSRHYVGIEISPEYIDLAKSRINDYYKQLDKLFVKKGRHYEVSRVIASV